jgi:hypothetical protein
MIIPVKSFYLSLFPYEGVGGDAASGGALPEVGGRSVPQSKPSEGAAAGLTLRDTRPSLRQVSQALLGLAKSRRASAADHAEPPQEPRTLGEATLPCRAREC